MLSSDDSYPYFLDPYCEQNIENEKFPKIYAPVQSLIV